VELEIGPLRAGAPRRAAGTCAGDLEAEAGYEPETAVEATRQQPGSLEISGTAAVHPRRDRGAEESVRDVHRSIFLAPRSLKTRHW
jgi:hypothetical protein